MEKSAQEKEDPGEHRLGKLRLTDSEREPEDRKRRPAGRQGAKELMAPGHRQAGCSEAGEPEDRKRRPAGRQEMSEPGSPGREPEGQRSGGGNRGRQAGIPSAALESGGKRSALENVKEQVARRRNRRIRRVLYCFGTVLVVIYIAVAVYFGSHFYEGTELFGIDCSQQTARWAKAEISEKLGEYRLELKERGGKSEFITAEQIGLEFVDNSGVDRMMKAQKPYLWPVMMMLERSGLEKVAFKYDRKKALDTLGELDCMDPLLSVAPKDAYIRTTETGFVVESEVMGTTLEAEKTQEALLKALDGGKTVLDLEDCYAVPELYQDDEELQRVAAAKSELARANITYDFGTQQEVVNAPVLENWMVELADGSFVIDETCAIAYVEGLAEKYDTFGMPRDFYTTLGTVVTLSGGDYGWCIDQGATVVELLNALQEGYQGILEPVYTYTAKSRENGDIGYTYVEICISQQRMWCYKDGTCIVDTPVVTGNPNKGNATPSGGVWAIDAKKENAVLVGEGYQAPVAYWMPFNGDVGIHDMQTRYYFGGTIYLTNGSHGCVNTPYQQAQTIYYAVEVGTPVIVYD